MIYFRHTIVFVFCIIFICLEGLPQGCCSGGVPIANNIGLAPAPEKTFQVQLLYDLNVLNTLKERDQKLDDDSRTRKTNSFLLQSGYSFNKKISAELIFSWIKQQRIIEQFGNKEKTQTNGIGDAVLLFKYNISSSKKSIWQMGIGSKFPLGAFDRVNESGLALSADLQPGTGSFDGILFSLVQTRLSSRSSLIFFGNGIYALKGTNRKYLDDQSYKTGNEIVITTGLSDQFIIDKLLINASFSTLFRWAGTDLFNNSDVPGTGGKWIFIKPSLGVQISPRLSWGINSQFPVYSFVNETQVTPSLRINTGFYFSWNTKKNDPIKKSEL